MCELERTRARVRAAFRQKDSIDGLHHSGQTRGAYAQILSGSILEITHCFPFPAPRAEPEEFEQQPARRRRQSRLVLGFGECVVDE